MAMWFYYDGAGNKQGPINDTQLKSLAASSKINQETVLETDKGLKGKAGKVKGLFPAPKSNPGIFDIQPPAEPAPKPVPTAPSPGSVFCTSCGKPISENAVACMSCGADPRIHRSFCRNCGTVLNPNQVICIRCGCGIANGQKESKTGFSRNKKTTGLPGTDVYVEPPIFASVIVLLFGPIFGIFSLVLSIQASGAAKRGDYAEAISKAKTARTIN